MFEGFIQREKSKEVTQRNINHVKYRGPILRVTSQALASDDSTLDQSATSIQILLQSRDMLFIKVRLYLSKNTIALSDMLSPYCQLCAVS